MFPFTYKAVHALVASLALLATVVLWCHLTATRRGATRTARVLAATLALLGVLCLGAWWNFGRLHYGRYVHVHEFFHYYLGAKYHRELGYTQLYRCVVAADVEAGQGADVSRRWVRDLATNALENGATVALQRDTCVSRFTPERWAAFVHDVGWLRRRVDAKKWSTFLTDHGYNATPVWTMTGSWLANLVPASDRGILALALVDPVLIGVMWGLACWAFGWQAACVAAIWWGTNLASRFSWTGGAFLRADWLLLTVAALCFTRRGHHLAGGFALGWATLLRVFPGYIGVALLLNELATWTRARRVAPSAAFVRFVAGGALALAVLLPLSSWALGKPAFDTDHWHTFVSNSRKHLSTPLTNHVGLRPVVAFAPSARATVTRDLWLDAPWDAWKNARQRVFAQRQVLYWALVAAFLALLARAVAGEEHWVALALGLGLIPIAAELTSYYYSVLLGYGFLWVKRQWVGVGLAATSFATCLMAILPMDDDRFVGVSVVIVLFVVAVTTAWVGARPATECPQSQPTSASR